MKRGEKRRGEVCSVRWRRWLEGHKRGRGRGRARDNSVPGKEGEKRGGGGGARLRRSEGGTVRRGWEGVRCQIEKVGGRECARRNNTAASGKKRGIKYFQ